MDKLLVWLRNATHFHERMMMRFLQKRGWVVFYLMPDDVRICRGDTCWMKLYQQNKPINSIVERTKWIPEKS